MQLTWCAMWLVAVLPMLAAASLTEDKELLTLLERFAANRAATKRDVPTPVCNDFYKAMPGHGICKAKSTTLFESGVSDADIKVIVDTHNVKRQNPYPKAAPLVGTKTQKMAWHPQMAVVAQALANTCVFEHDENRNVVGFGAPIGQNIAAGQTSWVEVINDWFAEVADFEYGTGSTGGETGHYVQIVTEDTARIGCGFAKCSTTDPQWGTPYFTFYVCNYVSTFREGSDTNPFTAGVAASECPNTAVNGLCDCGGKVCENEGTLDPATCQCTCNQDYAFTGATCATLTCPAADDSECSASDTLENCWQMSYTRSQCPYKCGICKK